MSENYPATCPFICPSTAQPVEQKKYKEAGQGRTTENIHAVPYVPGLIKPFKPKVYPPDAPPRYLPQFTDSTSGDILGMGPFGPWAPGHLDWTPQAGMTGVRPVVDKYSITRYSTGEWRKNNQRKLSSNAIDLAKVIENRTKDDIASIFTKLDNKAEESHKSLKKRVKDLSHWKKQVQATVQTISDEVNTLEKYRTRLKGACKILMIPEAISRECLELRTQRLEPDLVRDEAEQELIKEVSIVGEIRRLFQSTLAKVDEQLLNNKSAKFAIESDWSDKVISLNLDKLNLSLSQESSLILYYPGVARWTENSTPLDYWEHYCTESIKNCEEVRKKSVDLRSDLMTAIVKGSQDMKTQAQRTNAALAETVATTEALCEKLEDSLKENLKTIVNIENLMDVIKNAIRQTDERNKCAMTRLHSRNFDRPGVENCRDEAQKAIMGEAEFVKDTIFSLKDRLREADNLRSDLMQHRGKLEKEISSKRKCLNIDRDRLGSVRAHMPSPEEFYIE